MYLQNFQTDWEMEIWQKLNERMLTKLQKVTVINNSEISSFFIIFKTNIFLRQKNILEINHASFPNKGFQNSVEFAKIAKKLFWSCHENITRFGYKRGRMNLAYPGLCAYYDQYFYTNSNLKDLIMKGKRDIFVLDWDRY